MNTSKALVVGLPESGKSTFIAALWYVVQAEEVASALRLKELHGNRAHLNALTGTWLNCATLDRTAVAGEEVVEMRLESRDGSVSVDLVLPDFAGESFRLQWTDRRWPREYDEFVRDSVGALLFVHSCGVSEPIRIDQADYVAGEVEAAASPRGSAQMSGGTATSASQQPAAPGQAGAEPVAAWDPAGAPTQVQLVDLLQLMLTRHKPDQAYRVAVVVSAWDLVPVGTAPGEWVRKRLPLLYQFLEANADRVVWRPFGVSAQGGDYKDRERLQAAHRPSERIIVVGAATGEHDITSPVSWVVSLS